MTFIFLLTILVLISCSALSTQTLLTPQPEYIYVSASPILLTIEKPSSSNACLIMLKS